MIHKVRAEKSNHVILFYEALLGNGNFTLSNVFRSIFFCETNRNFQNAKSRSGLWTGLTNSTSQKCDFDEKFKGEFESDFLSQRFLT